MGTSVRSWRSYKNAHISFVNSVSPSCPSCWTDFHSTAINESDKCYKQTLYRWTGTYFMPDNLFPLSSAFWLSKSGQRIVTFFSVWQQTVSGLDSLNFRFLDHTHTYMVGILWTSDQIVAEAATYAIYNKHNRRTSTPSARCEPAFPAIKGQQICVLDHTTTGSDQRLVILEFVFKFLQSFSLHISSMALC